MTIYIYDYQTRKAIIADLVESKNNALSLGLVEVVEAMEKQIDKMALLFSLCRKLSDYGEALAVLVNEDTQHDRQHYLRGCIVALNFRIESLGLTA